MSSLAAAADNLDDELAKEMAALEASLALLNASVGNMTKSVQRAEADAALADRLDDARRDVSAAVLGLVSIDDDAADADDDASGAAAAARAAPAVAAALRDGRAAVHDGFLGAVAAARAVRRDVLALDAAAPFAAGRVANDLREAAVRADRCRFAAPASDGLAALAKACDALAAALAGLAVDCAPPDRLRHRSDPQCAIFARGPGYAKHVDNPRNTNGRRLTLVYYANESIGDGGELRVDGRDIAPLADRLVVFAAETAVHEVRPLSSGWDDPRVAVTFWYCDYDKSATAADDADDADRDRDALATLAAARRTLVQ